MKKIFAGAAVAALLVFPSPATAAPVQLNDSFVVIAHKTGPDDAPENTVAGIAKAKQLNPELSWVEVDVRWNKSDFPFLMHDPTVDRTTTGTGNLADAWYGDVMKMNAADYAPWNAKNTNGTWKYPDYHGTTVFGGADVDKLHPPYAWEFVYEASKQNVNLLMDVKDIPDKDGADKLYEYISRFSYQTRVIYMSNPASIAAMRSFYPDLDYMVIEYPASGTMRTAESIKSLGASGYAVPVKEITESKVDYYHANNLKVFTWSSDSTAIDTPANWALAHDAGVDALITNKHVAVEDLY